jgi:type VI secretion system FHA domain protein
MKLKLSVISYKGKPPDAAIEASFDQDGGTLGRSMEQRENHLCLQDPEKFISRRHAVIKSDKGIFYLTDTSVDGTYIVNKRRRVCQETVAIEDKDRLQIGDYELSVQIQSNKDVEPRIYSPAQFSQEDESIFDFAGGKQRLDFPLKASPDTQKNGLWQSAEDIAPGPPAGKHLAETIEDAPHRDSLALPDIGRPAENSSRIPENYDFEELIADLNENRADGGFAKPQELSILHGDSALIGPEAATTKFPSDDRLVRPAPNQDPPEHASPISGQVRDMPTSQDRNAIEPIPNQASLELLNASLEGAGIMDSNLPDPNDAPDFMRAAGGILREMVAGLIAILRGRTELKNQFRMPLTVLKPDGNNPLKFCKIVDDALKHLLIKNRPGFVNAHEAVQDSFRDIQNHELAMAAGVQAAVIALLKRFDPEDFAKPFEEGLAFQRKAKSWDAYQKAFTDVASQALEQFFGEAFIQAYEEQLRKLR